jgi:hypothetical protein
MVFRYFPEGFEMVPAAEEVSVVMIFGSGRYMKKKGCLLAA